MRIYKINYKFYTYISLNVVRITQFYSKTIMIVMYTWSLFHYLLHNSWLVKCSVMFHKNRKSHPHQIIKERSC